MKDFSAASLASSETLQKLFLENVMYNEFAKLRGTPHYWKDVQKDIRAFLRQNGNAPTFFFTLSMADTKWTELINILIQMRDRHGKKTDQTEELLDINNFDVRAKLIREDPITCARYFLHRRRALFNNLLLGGRMVLGEIEDYFGVVEFQYRGSPHCHFLVWVKDPPKVDPEKKNYDTVRNFVDNFVSTDADALDPDLAKVQTHRHTKRCGQHSRKQKIVSLLRNCSFGFPAPPLLKTTVFTPLHEGTDQHVKEAAKKNWIKIQSVLENNEFPDDCSFEQFLQLVKLSETDYNLAIQSSIRKEKVFYKRLPKHCFINPFNLAILERWRANMDIQYCLHPYSIAEYVSSYMCKGNRAMSRALRKMQEILEKNPNITFGGGLRLIANALIKSREISVQEAVFIILGLPLRFASRSVKYVNTNFPENRLLMMKTQEEIEKLPSTSNEIFQPYALVTHYENRSIKDEDTCLADYASYSKTFGKSKKNLGDGDDEICDLDVDKMESDDLRTNHRKKGRILRFNNYKLPDGTLCPNYIWEKILLFVPFRCEKTLFQQNHMEIYNQNIERISDKILEYSPSHEDWDDLIDAAEGDLEDMTTTVDIDKIQILMDGHDPLPMNEFDQIMNSRQRILDRSSIVQM